MYNIVICDDNIQVIQELKTIIEKKYKNLIHIECVDNLVTYESSVMKNPMVTPDLIIMDIRWREEDVENRDGISAAVGLQSLFPQLKIIFLTGYIQYAPDIFEAKPSAFLTKPVKEDKLTETIDKILGELEMEKTAAISIHTGSEVISLYPKEILYMESNKHELILHLTGGTKRLWGKLDEMGQKFPSEFIRIHQSYLVNATYIRTFGSQQVVLMTGEKLTISRSRYKSAKEKFMDYLERS